jgi:hypothetical protein
MQRLTWFNAVHLRSLSLCEPVWGITASETPAKFLQGKNNSLYRTSNYCAHIQKQA